MSDSQQAPHPDEPSGAAVTPGRDVPAQPREPGLEGAASEAGGQRIVTTIAEVSERATLLIHEEIELAKAEVAEKVSSLLTGAVVGLVAGIFFITALLFVLIGGAWLLYYYLPIGSAFTYFWGFFAMAGVLVILGVAAGVIASKTVRKSSPPVPNMAIEEARKIRETVSAGSDLSPRAPVAARPPAEPYAAPSRAQPPPGEAGS